MSLNPPPDAALAAILGAVTKVSRRVDFYEEDGTTPFLLDVPYSDGSVTVDSTRDERRMFDLVVGNPDRSIHHSENGLWYDKVVKLRRGVEYGNGLIWDVQVGEFLIDQIKSQHFPYTIAINGRDFTAKLIEDKFTVSTTFVKGQAIEAVIRTIAQNGLIVKFNLPVTGQFTGKDFTFEKGTTRWAAISDIATTYGYEVFFDANGYLTMREFLDPALSATSFSFKTGTDGSIVSWDKTTNQTRVYNQVIVYGDTDGTTLPLHAVATNNDPNSPTSVQRLRRTKSYEYTSSFFTSVEQCQAMADKLLRIVGLEEYAVNMQTLVFPWLDAGEVVDFLPDGRELTDPTRFLLSGFTIPLGLGPMNPACRRVEMVS